MRIRRCSTLLIEPAETLAFQLDSLLSGGDGLQRGFAWRAIVPHLGTAIELDMDELAMIGRLSPTRWADQSGFSAQESLTIQRLVEKGVLVCDRAEHGVDAKTTADETLRATHWWPLAAAFHCAARWHGVDSVDAMERNDMDTVHGLLRKYGRPPSADAEARVDLLELPRAPATEFDELLRRRATCRNFDATATLDKRRFSMVLERVFAAQAMVAPEAGVRFLKKNSPSGGGLHPTEAYLIVQRVDGVPAGLYHYCPLRHALRPIESPVRDLAEFARRAVAGQHWFADAPVLAILAPRYERSFWKYRQHAKAYRALILDSGHLSQTLYLSATDLDLGAFVTAAINEVDIEQAFAMDPLVEGPLAICGFGERADRMRTTEFDPNGQVWEQPSSLGQTDA